MTEQHQENVIDFNKICRLCLMEESVMSSIYNDQDKHSAIAPLSLKIMACVSVELNPVDGLPSQICTACLCQVDSWYKFKDLCETADTVLRKCIKNEPVQIETISDVRSKAKEIKKFLASSYLMNVEGFNSVCDEITSAKDPLKNVESVDARRGIKLCSFLKFGTKTALETPSEVSPFDSDKAKSNTNEHNGLPNASKKGKGKTETDVEIDPAKEADAKFSGNSSDFSSDDEVSLSTRKKMILEERERNKKLKQKKNASVVGEKRPANLVKYFRTIKLQTESDGRENSEEGTDEKEETEKDTGSREPEVVVSETEVDASAPFEITSSDRKKMKSRKTQTPRGGSGEGGAAKKRFRIRPAVPSSCTLCDKVYKNGEILRQHMKSHHVTGTIECSHCKLTFTSLRSLKYHEHRKHSNLEPVPCSFCGKKFLDKKYLRIHENIHSQANHFVCQFCGRKFIMKTNLTVHISRHHTKKSNDFVCQICGKAFPFKLYLKKHFKTHTDEKPYQCPHCDAKFRENTLLQKHVNSIHLKLRPFLCQWCHKTFTRSLYLREHMESQHLGIQKKVECSRCGENFQNRNRLRQHECLGQMEIISVE